MKKILIAAVLITMLLTACSGLGPSTNNTSGTTGADGTSQQTSQSTSETQGTAEETIADYFPMTADVNMKYKGTGNEYAQYETYVDFIKANVMQIRENNGGTEMVKVYAVKNGALVNTFSRGETYFRYDYTAMSEKEDILLKEPLVTGTAWKTPKGYDRSITAIDSQVETPAGKFTAIEVTTKGKDSETKDYYAKGTGLVKTVFKTNETNSTITSELEKLEKGVPFKQKVKFYFPQFDKDRIVYVEREISLKTNQDMKWQFQKELKTIPDKGGLGKTLTKNTQIRSISLDDKKDTVTVDLSGDFIKEMNAGTTLEGMLVDSISSTFGSYYLKSKCIILIDGKPYESGHILMKEGEAFDVKTEGIARFVQ